MTDFRLKRVLCAILSVVMIFSVLSFSAGAADTKADLQQKSDDAEAAIQANKEKIAALQTQIDNAKTTNGYSSEQITALQQQLDIYKDQIADLNDQIKDKNAVISQYQSEIDSLQADIDDANATIETQNKKIETTYELLKERMRAAYKAGETSTLEVLLTATDYESFLTRLELLSKTSKHDKQLVSDLQDEVTNLKDTKELLAENQQSVIIKQTAVQDEKTAIESSKAEVKSLSDTVETKQTALERQVQQRNISISNMSTSSAEYEAANAEIQKEKDEYDDKIADLMETGSGTLPGTSESTTSGGSSSDGDSSSSGDSSSGSGSGDSSSGDSSSDSGYKVSSKGMICPLQYSNVTVSAGWYGYPNHKGIDLITSGATGNTYGKEIRAAADGIVSTAEWHYSWGNNVYINHGNGVYTRYAHCSKLLVSKGDKVKQGQVIALVGNTGSVSPAPTEANPHAGAHLHFEVWINGTRVNPAPYLP